MEFLSLASNGIGNMDMALALVRATAGTFFMLSGFNKLTNKGRHASLVNTLKEDHVPAIKFNQWWVPGWEFFGGLMVVLGLLGTFAAGVLFIICSVACLAEAKKRVDSYQPINKADVVDDYLYLPEVIYMALLVVVIMCGSGAYSVDALIK